MLKEGLINIINDLLTACYGEALQIGDGTLITFTGAQSGYAGLWAGVLSLADIVIEPIAICLVVLYFLMGMVDKLSSENFGMEQAIKELIKLFMGVYLVSNSLNLIVDLISLGNGILKRTQNYLLGSIPSPDLTLSSLGDSPVPALLVIVVLISIILIVQWLVMLAMKAVCVIRLVDIVVRAAMSPIALSDMFSGSFLNSHAMNFIRSFAAVCLQGALIIIIASFVPAGMDAVLTSGDYSSGMELLGAISKTIPITLACLLVMLRSGSIAKELLGAR